MFLPHDPGFLIVNDSFGGDVHKSLPILPLILHTPTHCSSHDLASSSLPSHSCSVHPSLHPIPSFPISHSIKQHSSHYLPSSLLKSHLPSPAFANWFENLAYKKVENKIRPVATTLPDEYRIVRRKHPDPLHNLPPLPHHAPPFVPGKWFTEERRQALAINSSGFLWPEEELLATHLILMHEDAFAWNEMEKGSFRDEWFDPIVIPVIEHVPWAFKNIPIPAGIRDRVIQIIKEKTEAGVYEPTNSSYRSRWFCVVKKDGKSLRLVHSLKPLNTITIKDAAVPPHVDPLAESFAGRSVYSLLDLYVSFDQRRLDPRSRDLTAFQTPIGARRLTSIPQGWTGSIAVLQGDMAHILEEEIPHITDPYVDDVPIKGPASHYILPDGSYEVDPENPGVRCFIREHLLDVSRVIQ